MNGQKVMPSPRTDTNDEGITLDEEVNPSIPLCSPLVKAYPELYQHFEGLLHEWAKATEEGDTRTADNLLPVVHQFEAMRSNWDCWSTEERIKVETSRRLCGYGGHR